MPNAQGGMTAEEEAAWIAQRLQGSQYTPPTENLGWSPPPETQPSDPAFIGLGPPYTEQGAYAGPPPITPEIWRGAESDPGDPGVRGGNIDASAPPPPGALDFSAGTAAPANWEDFKGNTSTGGGFFTIRDLFESRGQPVPPQFAQGSDMASTNNYRLFGGSPGYIMRNGFIINTNDVTSLFGPYGIGGMFDTTRNNPRWSSGAGAGFPAAYAPGSVSHSIGGWPGSGILALLSTPGT